jgi:hypothetical protein
MLYYSKGLSNTPGLCMAKMHQPSKEVQNHKKTLLQKNARKSVSNQLDHKSRNPTIMSPPKLLFSYFYYRTIGCQ